MQSTATDFWTMVWEKKSYAIVVLGQIKENEAVIILPYADIYIYIDCSIRKLHLSIGQLRTRVLSLADF